MRLTGSRNLCSACGEHFNSTATFDKHRTGGYQPPHRRCASPAEMRVAGMSLNTAGFWIITKRVFLAAIVRVETAIGRSPSVP